MKNFFLTAGIVIFLSGIITGAGKEVGVIGNIDPGSKEVTVSVKSGTNLIMGDQLEIQTESGNIILDVTFPMQTVVKCRIKGKGRASELKKGMVVYRYDKMSVKSAGKSGQIKVFGNIEFAFIEGGTYTMGSPESEMLRHPAEKQHQVNVSSFWMGKYEVMQKEYMDVMGKNPSDFKGDDLPVQNVSWYDAVEFCNALSVKQGLNPYYSIDKKNRDRQNKNGSDDFQYTVTIVGGNGFRLPTEAEWEYACRAGTTTVFHYGDKLDSTMANFNGSEPYNAEKGVVRKTIIKTGSFEPNAFGLYDMHGNIWEWCWDWYAPYTTVPDNPTGADKGKGRVRRGGSWHNKARHLRSAFREDGNPGKNIRDFGFRIVRGL
jgi:formylglycine-generating enzyme required for sulfatase activity